MTPDQREQLRRREDRWLRARRYGVLAAFVILSFGNAWAIKQVHDRAEEIQRSRIEVIYRNCIETNRRHHQTVRQYDRQIDIAKRSGLLKGERLERAEESRRFTLALVDQLVPYTDCRSLVARRLGAGALRDLE